LFGTFLVLGQATGNFGFTRLTTARTWGEATTFPYVLFFVPLHGAYIQMVFFFVSGLGSPEIAKVWTPATLRDYNSLFNSLIGMMSKVML
jgi:hypothetical protein